MSIGMERFGSIGQRSESDAASEFRNPAFPFRLQCRACGFEPADAIIAPPRCPKCKGSAWEQFAFPGSLLMNASRYSSNRPASRALIAGADPALKSGPELEDIFRDWSEL